ncbi:hypothetical protein JAAARDRAFT_29513 [Jaapia argillacea MUCL 33604]|uniref:CN hydrolase domain-containing protein n=1 Tax=Jaapia argillacea MUCL 33604 TaxID=933084 RepID=A0A067Q8X8_9AGAM|nr:hypothetical protein JAAARDRAFT_29513 [Jaapia argillacea MUCL 33604]
MPRTIKASVVQTCTESYNLEATLDKLEKLTRIAKDRDGSQLAVFPEAFIGGYPKHSTFSAVVGLRNPEGRDEYLAYHNAAIPVHPDSPAIKRICAISKETGVFLVVGVIEKDVVSIDPFGKSGEVGKESVVVTGGGGTLYCTAIFVDPEEGLVGKHRKLVPTALERLVWGTGGGGKNLSLYEKEFRKVGGEGVGAKMSAAICWENYMPLLRTYYYSQGTQIYIAPTVDSRPSWQSTMTHIALEGRTHVLSACQFAQESHYPPSHPVADPLNRKAENVMIAGGSVIISPLGEVLAGPVWGEGEIVLSAELDLDDGVRGVLDLDVVGHYARDDIFQLRVLGQSS